jgi:hypothetical protein
VSPNPLYQAGRVIYKTPPNFGSSAPAVHVMEKLPSVVATVFLPDETGLIEAVGAYNTDYIGKYTSGNFG